MKRLHRNVQPRNSRMMTLCVPPPRVHSLRQRAWRTRASAFDEGAAGPQKSLPDLISAINGRNFSLVSSLMDDGVVFTSSAAGRLAGREQVVNHHRALLNVVPPQATLALDCASSMADGRIAVTW